jgi:hypothetical protein
MYMIKMCPNPWTIWGSKKMPPKQKLSPKWQSDAKSGHTGCVRVFSKIELQPIASKSERV